MVILLGSAGLYGYYYHFDNLLVRQFDRGLILEEQGEYEKAADLFRDLVRKQPGLDQSPRALFRSGEILHLYLQKYREALLVFLQIEKDYPDSEFVLPARRRIAEIYKYRIKDYPRAIVAYNKLLDRGKEGTDRIRYEIADAYFREGNFEQARIEFEGLIKENAESPLVPEAQYRIAVTHSLEGAQEKAEEFYQTVMEKWPESPFSAEAGYGLAAVLEERDELKEALRILEGLRTSYPKPEVLEAKIRQIETRINKKKKAI